ncbi:MAG: NAD(P)H-hydrate dehydratase [Clostridia bacterium]|nr:NAD(P)H-hydrate dehydratase [Clostridia bacterium]
MKACSASQMREIDQTASEKGMIPSIVLMENAALSCVLELKKTFSDLKHKSIAIFCGKGNNGGDGFAIAKHLYNMGVNVSVYLLCGNNFLGDAKINYDIITGMGVSIETVVDTAGFEYVIRSYDIVIDAIFGTGISGNVRGIAGEIIPLINENAKYILSVDVPSGMETDSGEVLGECIKANKTVTFAAYKIGMFKFPAADYTGKVVVYDISIPQYIIDELNINVNVIDRNFVKEHFPKRLQNSQKGDYGKVLIIAGSKGMSGAAYLSSQAAQLTGSGLVTLAIPKSLNGIMEAKTTEVMTIPLPDEDGHLSDGAGEVIEKIVNKYDAVLIGPGLSRGVCINNILHRVLKTARIPVIIDADGINALAWDMEILSDAVCPVIFTPHAVEMSRLSGLNKDYIEANRFEVSEQFCEKYGVTLLLKGRYSLVTTPDKKQYINITGNPGLATGGSGDVLAGIIASLVARGIDEGIATAMSSYIHGLAGDICAKKYGMESVIATKVMECIPDAICQILQVEN